MIIQLFSANASKLENYVDEKSIVLLIQDGVYALNDILRRYPKCAIYILENDWQASGLLSDGGCKIISDKDWVLLCAQHSPIVTLQD